MKTKLHVLNLLALVILLHLSGCMAIQEAYYYDGWNDFDNSSPHPKECYYLAVRKDLEHLRVHNERVQNHPSLKVVKYGYVAIEMPFSFCFDTIILPFNGLDHLLYATGLKTFDPDAKSNERNINNPNQKFEPTLNTPGNPVNVQGNEAHL